MFKKEILIVLLLTGAIALANPLKPYLYNKDFQHLSLYYKYIEDCKSLSTSEVVQEFENNKFISPTPMKAFSSGVSSCSYWLAVEVKNATEFKQKLLWSFHNNGLTFKLYELKNGELIFIDESSMHKSIQQRPYPARTVSFPFNLDTNQTKILFVKVSPTVNKNIYFPTKILAVEDFLQYELEFSYRIGKYFGVLMLTFFINICMLIILRRKIYFYNIFYILFVFLFQLSDFHFDAFEISDRFFYTWSYVNKDFYVGMSMFFYALVFQIFVEFHLHFPKLIKIFNFLKFSLLFASVLTLITSFYFTEFESLFRFINLIVNALIYLMIGFIFVVIIIGIYRKIRFFALFGLSFAFLFYGFLSYLLNTLNIISLPIIRPGNVINGSVTEVVLLTIFFVYKFKIEREIDAFKILTETRKNAELSKKMLTIESEEQERLSKNIHDEIGSDITGLRLQLENQLLESNIVSYQQELILENVKSLYEKVRDLSHFMKPTVFNVSFIETVENQISFYRKNVSHIKFELITNIKKTDDFELEVQIQLIRILKEVFTNALKHALASKISLQLIYEKQALLVIIEDNGIGFDQNAKFESSGLENMKSRVAFLSGKINIDSNKNGTSIILEIPIL